MRAAGLPTRATGMALGVIADLVLADPARGHPVAGFGRLAQTLETRVHAPARGRGIAFTAAAVGVPVALAWAVERHARDRPVLATALTAFTTWSVLGGTSLVREGRTMAGHLERADLPAARARLSWLCARDPAGLEAGDLARATVESLAENTSDAAVAPLLWGAVAGVPGLVGYRAINTLDAMVGYRSPRYREFGWASARLDDLVNLIPSRVTALLTVAVARRVGGDPGDAWRAWRRDGSHHPSPNAGQCEAAAAGALGVRLGGRNRYGEQAEDRPTMGDGDPPAVPDVRRAARLARLVSLAGAGLAVALAAVPGAGARVGRPGRGGQR